MSYRTDYKRAHGWGPAHDGVGHFRIQRITAVALVPLTIFFIFPFMNALGSGYDAVHEIYRNAWNALSAIGFFIIAFWHMKIGIQVIIEDYTHNRRWRIRLLVLNIFFNWSFAAAGVFAVAKIAFSA